MTEEISILYYLKTEATEIVKVEIGYIHDLKKRMIVPLHWKTLRRNP